MTADSRATKPLNGQPIDLGGTIYHVPSLSALEVARAVPLLVALDEKAGSLSLDDFGVLLDIALQAIRKNYPRMTREELGAIVDTGNATALFRIVLGGHLYRAPR